MGRHGVAHRARILPRRAGARNRRRADAISVGQRRSRGGTAGASAAVFGAAAWDRWDPASDRFSIYVRGLSDGYKEIPNPKGGKPTVKYKTLRIDFIRRGGDPLIEKSCRVTKFAGQRIVRNDTGPDFIGHDDNRTRLMGESRNQRPARSLPVATERSHQAGREAEPGHQQSCRPG